MYSSLQGKKSFTTAKARQHLDRAGETKVEDHCPHSGCVVCADPDPKYWANMSDCGHKTCSTCALRLQVLYASQVCPLCKSICDKVCIGSERADLKGVKVKNFYYRDMECLRSVEGNLVIRCRQCGLTFGSLQDLSLHLQKHGLKACEVCVKEGRVFSHELQLFKNDTQLLHHQRKEHRCCPACSQLIYGEEELRQHCLKYHEICFICEGERRRLGIVDLSTTKGAEERRRMEQERSITLNSNVHAPYYKDVDALHQHFDRAHYPCKEPICVEAKFIAFATELELKAHVLEVHPIDPSRKIQRSGQTAIRRLDLSFPYQRSSSTRSSEHARTEQATASSRVSTPENTISTIFGLIPPELIRRLQTVSTLDTRNRELLQRIDQLGLNRDEITTACTSYNAGQYGADELVRRLSGLIPYEVLRGQKETKKGGVQKPSFFAWLPLTGTQKNAQNEPQREQAGLYAHLLEVLPDEGKKRLLSAAFSKHFECIEGFPELEPEIITKGIKELQIKEQKPVLINKTSPSGFKVLKIVGNNKNTLVKKPEILVVNQVKTKEPAKKIVKPVEEPQGDTFVIGGETGSSRTAENHTESKSKKRDKGKLIFSTTQHRQV